MNKIGAAIIIIAAVWTFSGYGQDAMAICKQTLSDGECVYQIR